MEILKENAITRELLSQVDSNLANLYDTLSDEVKDKISNQDYKGALKLVGSIDEEDTIIKVGIVNELNSLIGINLLKQLSINYNDILVHIFKNLGFDGSKNPFIDYIQNNRQTSSLLDEDVLIILYNLLIDGVLDANDIIGQSIEGMNHIIFNPSLYQNNDEEDIEDILKSYSFLSDVYKLKKLNYKSLYDYYKNQPKYHNDVLLKLIDDRNYISDSGVNKIGNNDINAIRNAFIYKDGNKAIRDIKEIRAFLQKASAEKASQSKDRYQVVQDIKKNLRSLDKEVVKTLVQELVNEFKININNVEDSEEE